ncbi:MAG: DUF6702 family protein [Flavobacterium sp.]
MKRILQSIVLLVMVAGLTSAAAHKFYVGVFQLEYVPAKKQVQLTSRLFVDDIEATLNKKYGKRFYFTSKQELPEAEDYLKKYLAEKMEISINGKVQPVKFIGRELEDDVLICYYTIAAPAEVKSIKVSNSILMESFGEQQNIIHAKINGNRKSLLLTNDKREGTLEF